MLAQHIQHEGFTPLDWQRREKPRPIEIYCGAQIVAQDRFDPVSVGAAFGGDGPGAQQICAPLTATGGRNQRSGGNVPLPGPHLWRHSSDNLPQPPRFFAHAFGYTQWRFDFDAIALQGFITFGGECYFQSCTLSSWFL